MSTPLTPASGAVSIGVNRCNNRLPTRPLSPCITVPRPRSADVDSASPSGGGRRDPAPNSGCVRALHRPDLSGHRTPHDGAEILAHRHAHNDDQACRSTRQHPPPAATTVRAAQDSVLPRIEERLSPDVTGFPGSSAEIELVRALRVWPACIYINISPAIRRPAHLSTGGWRSRGWPTKREPKSRS